MPSSVKLRVLPRPTVKLKQERKGPPGNRGPAGGTHAEFDTVAAVQAAAVAGELVAGTPLVRTLGYLTAGDFGAADYVWRSGVPAEPNGYFSVITGGYYELHKSQVLRPEMFGVFTTNTAAANDDALVRLGAYLRARGGGWVLEWQSGKTYEWYASVTSTSPTPNSLAATGTKSFVVGTGLDLIVGDEILFQHASNPATNWLFGYVTGYTSATGGLTIDVPTNASRGVPTRGYIPSLSSVVIPAVSNNITLTVTDDGGWSVGQAIRAQSAANEAYAVTGPVVSYSWNSGTSTGTLVMTVTGNSGQGQTVADWQIMRTDTLGSGGSLWIMSRTNSRANGCFDFRDLKSYRIEGNGTILHSNTTAPHFAYFGYVWGTDRAVVRGLKFSQSYRTPSRLAPGWPTSVHGLTPWYCYNANKPLIDIEMTGGGLAGIQGDDTDGVFCATSPIFRVKTTDSVYCLDLGACDGWGEVIADATNAHRIGVIGPYCGTLDVKHKATSGVDISPDNLLLRNASFNKGGRTVIRGSYRDVDSDTRYMPAHPVSLMLYDTGSGTPAQSVFDIDLQVEIKGPTSVPTTNNPQSFIYGVWYGDSPVGGDFVRIRLRGTCSGHVSAGSNAIDLFRTNTLTGSTINAGNEASTRIWYDVDMSLPDTTGNLVFGLDSFNKAGEILLRAPNAALVRHNRNTGGGPLPLGILDASGSVLASDFSTLGVVYRGLVARNEANDGNAPALYIDAPSGNAWTEYTINSAPKGRVYAQTATTSFNALGLTGYTFNFGANASLQWQVTTAGHLVPVTNNASSLGLTGQRLSKVWAVDADVSGALTVAGGIVKSVKKQVFTSSGTYTPSANMVYCLIEAVGGGGGGGSAAGTASNIYSGAGGGSGGYSRLLATAATIGASQTVTIGAGGSGGASGSNNGSAGGSTSVGSLCIALGGGGGLYGALAQLPTGGAGGAAGTGDLTAAGAPGQPGFYHTTGTAPRFPSGNGASSVLGGGAIGVSTLSTTAGNNASNYGSGGSGAATLNTTSTAAGGNGSAGAVWITEFCN